MWLMLSLFCGIALVEQLIWLKALWRWHKKTSLVFLVASALSALCLLVVEFRPWVALICVFVAYRLINLYRVKRSLLKDKYLYHATRATSISLLVLQLGCVAIAAGLNYTNLGIYSYAYALVILQLVTATILYVSLVRNLHKTSVGTTIEALPDANDMPSLSVLIPARNETDDLISCLQSVLSSNYPKLEILVLDDCSQNPKTPEIIRSFAHDGVRFIEGKAPPDKWLAKNYAYQQLADASSGDLLLFCGVDIRFKRETITHLVSELINRRKQMVCVVPKNESPLKGSLPLLIQPVRYAWELCFPRKFLKRPPVLSSAWVIRRKMLESVGGFGAVQRKIVPESYLAKCSADNDDGYSLLRSSPSLSVISAKSYAEQRSTAIRTRYPQLHRRVELVALLSLVELFLLLLPPFVLILAFAHHALLLGCLAGGVIALGIITFTLLSDLTYTKLSMRSCELLFVAAVYDICLLNYSMWRYEFSEVIWKDRNVCIPVMQSIPKLPDFRN